MSRDLTTLADGESDVDESTLDGDEKRQCRARTDRMVVIPDLDRWGLCTGLYWVRTTGGLYRVDVQQQRACDCPDAEYNRPEGGCKHRRRIIMMLNDDDSRLPGPEECGIDYVHDLRDLRDDLVAERTAVERHILLAGPAILMGASHKVERANAIDELLSAF